MDQIIKKEWAKRLRSEDYEQGQGYLQAQGKFCCLGVLCDIAADAGIVAPEAGHGFIEHFKYDGADNVLPVSVENWAGTGGPCPEVLYNGEDTSLWKLNDNEELTFNEIADLIEEQL